MTESKGALLGPRILTKDVGRAHFQWDMTEGKYIPAVTGLPESDWQGHGLGLYWENYFDLSGYNLDDLTLVPTLMDLQDAGIYYTGNFQKPTGTADEALFVVDIMSQERLDINDTFVNIIQTDFPSVGNSGTTFEQILMCNVRYMRVRTTYGENVLQNTITGGSYGSGEPTTVQKLWLYRFIVPLLAVPNIGGEEIICNCTRFILGANIIKESELSHMMRLKRSYELANYGN